MKPDQLPPSPTMRRATAKARQSAAQRRVEARR